jgi:hypothetical protein
MPLLAIHFGEPEAPSASDAHRVVRYPFVARVIQSQNTTSKSAHEAHGAIKVFALKTVTDPWSLSEASLVRALFRFARDHAETLARHQGSHMGGDHEFVLSPHEYSGPPPHTDEPPESTILQVELDNPIRHLAP